MKSKVIDWAKRGVDVHNHDFVKVLAEWLKSFGVEMELV